MKGHVVDSNTNNNWLLQMVIADSIGLVLLVVVLLKFPTLMTALIPLAFCVLVASNFIFMRRQVTVASQAPDPHGQLPKKANSISLYAVCLVFSVGIIRGIFMMLRGDISFFLIPLFVIPLSIIFYCLKLATGKQ